MYEMVAALNLQALLELKYTAKQY